MTSSIRHCPRVTVTVTSGPGPGVTVGPGPRGPRPGLRVTRPGSLGPGGRLRARAPGPAAAPSSSSLMVSESASDTLALRPGIRVAATMPRMRCQSHFKSAEAFGNVKAFNLKN